MQFIDYFNPHNLSHIDALKHQEKTGWWPLWFGDKVDQTDRHYWTVIAVAKCSEAWLDYVDYKQKCKTEFVPKISINATTINTKNIVDLVIKEINKRISARGIKDRYRK